MNESFPHQKGAAKKEPPEEVPVVANPTEGGENGSTEKGKRPLLEPDLQIVLSEPELNDVV
jgi:hypothetical protein